MRTLSQLHDGVYLITLPTLLEVSLSYLSYCHRKTFHEGIDKIHELSNLKCNYNLISRLKKVRDTATELGSKDIFLKDLELASKL